jgi:hypothetical protein
MGNVSLPAPAGPPLPSLVYMRIRTHARYALGLVPLVLLLAVTACDSPVEERDPPSIVLTSATRSLMAGTALQVTASVTETDGSASTRTVQWESSNQAVATVNGSGQVEGVGAGTATISAKVGGAESSIGITVMRAPTPSGPQSTFLAYTSMPGDFVGNGRTARFEVETGTWTATVSPRNEVQITYHGTGGQWDLYLAAPQGRPLDVGVYANATRWPFQAASEPGLWFIGGVGCNNVAGSFTIHDIAIDHERQVHRLHVTFRQHCERLEHYLDGEIALLLHPLR